MDEKKVTVKNLEVNYKTFGQGRPMLALHGWGSNSGRWQKVAELLAEKNVMVIIPDLPGFGATPAPKTVWNLDSYVEWLNEFCQNVPELTKDFYLLGHSFGGALAAKFSVKYNQKVTMLFLVSAACVRKITFSKKFFHALSKPLKIFSFLPDYALARKAFYKFVLKKSDYPYMKGIMKDIYVKVLSEDLSQVLSFIRVPTVIIWGQKDNLTPLSDAHFINKKIPRSKLIVIESAGHSLQVETPEVLTEKILGNLPANAYRDQLLSLKNII